MNAKLKYVLPILISFCFVEAAFEAFEETAEGAQEDRYDLYVLSSRTSSQVLKFDHFANFALLTNTTFLQPFRTKGLLLTAPTLSSQTEISNKLYLAYRSLLI